MATTTTHRSAPGPRGQVIDDLDREWTDLIHSGAFAAESQRWLQRWPALRPYFRTDDRPASARLDPAKADEILAALLAEHAAGSYNAGRMVLQCMLGSTVKIARRCTGRYAYDDAIAEAVAALWAAISTFPTTRTDRVASRLHFTTLDAVAGRRTIKVSDHEVAAGTGEDTQSHPDALPGLTTEEPHILGTTGEVLEVIAWGVDVEALTPQDAALLTRLYVPEDDTPPPDRAALAAELGITSATLRQRAHRAIRRLAQATHDQATLQI